MMAAQRWLDAVVALCVFRGILRIKTREVVAIGDWAMVMSLVDYFLIKLEFICLKYT